jgi:hypothetical protein
MERLALKGQGPEAARGGERVAGMMVSWSSLGFRALLAGRAHLLRVFEVSGAPASRAAPKMQRCSGTRCISSVTSPVEYYPCPRHLPRRHCRQSRALPFPDIQERGFRDLANPTLIKDADRNPVPLDWPFSTTRLVVMAGASACSSQTTYWPSPAVGPLGSSTGPLPAA